MARRSKERYTWDKVDKLKIVISLSLIVCLYTEPPGWLEPAVWALTLYVYVKLWAHGRLWA